MTKQIDWLGLEVLDALKDNPALNAGWFENKRNELAGESRLQVLRWICTALDSGNKKRVCNRLELTIEDLEATRRVLSKI